MTSTELLAVLVLAAREAVAAYAGRQAEAGVGALLKWIEERLSGSRMPLTVGDKSQLSELLTEAPTVWQRFCSLLSSDRRGIMLVGPSGAGKTHLHAGLTQTVRPTASKSTVDVITTNEFFSGRLVAVRDTPGRPEHGTGLWRALKEHRPSVLVLVVAYGYLSPAGTGSKLTLGGSRHPTRRKLDLFLDDAREEEIAFMKDLVRLADAPDEKVKHLLVVVNKMDVWLQKHHDALEYYRTDPAVQEALDAVLKKFVRPGQTAQIVTAAAEYDSFKTLLQADKNFSREASDDTVRLLKGLLATLLLDGKTS